MNTDIITPIKLRSASYREAGVEYDVAPHSHSWYQWYFVLHGSVDSIVDGKRHKLEAEDSIIVKPGCVRDRRCSGKAPGYMIIQFDDKGLEGLQSIVHRIMPLPSELRPDLHALIAEVRSPGQYCTKALIYSLTTRLLIGLIRIFAQNGPSRMTGIKSSALSSTHYRDISTRIETFMQNHLHRDLTRGQFAEFANLSPSHVARIFKQTQGVTLNQRLTELRVERAKQMLLETDMPITAIARDVGFHSFSHFTQLFRKVVGVSPSDYRRTNGLAWIHHSD